MGSRSRRLHLDYMRYLIVPFEMGLIDSFLRSYVPRREVQEFTPQHVGIKLNPSISVDQTRPALDHTLEYSRLFHLSFPFLQLMLLEEDTLQPRSDSRLMTPGSLLENIISARQAWRKNSVY